MSKWLVLHIDRHTKQIVHIFFAPPLSILSRPHLTYIEVHKDNIWDNLWCYNEKGDAKIYPSTNDVST